MPEITTRIITRLHPLTVRQTEVLVHIASGLSNKEIATELGVATKTVETHRERIMRKLDIHNVVGLTKFACRHKLVEIIYAFGCEPRKTEVPAVA